MQVSTAVYGLKTLTRGTRCFVSQANKPLLMSSMLRRSDCSKYARPLLRPWNESSHFADIDRSWKGISSPSVFWAYNELSVCQDINDLAVSPLSPSILASASLDYSVRFWSLDPAHDKQPCMLICGGEGHREGLLSLVWAALRPEYSAYCFTGLSCVWSLSSYWGDGQRNQPLGDPGTSE